MSIRGGHFLSARNLLLPALLLLLAHTPAQATRVRAINLEEMTQRAARIVSGRCVDVRVEEDPTVGAEVTLVTLEVDRTAKGRAEPLLTFRTYGGLGPGGTPSILGMPRFRPGEEVILFLAGESSLGLTSPVGFGQGKFVVSRDKQGRRMALNEGANRTLFRGLSGEASRLLGAQAQPGRARDGIPPEALLGMVETLEGARKVRP